MYYMYILQSQKDARTYVGCTNNLPRRLKQHNAGRVASTKYRKPLKILFAEKFATRQEAEIREHWWKTGTGRRKLKKFFRTGYPARRLECDYASWVDPRKDKQDKKDKN